MREILRVSHLCKKDILKDISFSVEEGEMVAVMGPSGSGKSTLLYQVSGLDRADAGEVWLDDQEIVGLSEDDRARLRLHQMGFVFQQMNMRRVPQGPGIAESLVTARLIHVRCRASSAFQLSGDAGEVELRGLGLA